ncbi:hypothetical protein IQ64_26865 [Streptomyces stelliscabiei]|nr:hypothetical protein IQ64_26865 [Streptomyces stelliscabiei]
MPASHWLTVRSVTPGIFWADRSAVIEWSGCVARAWYTSATAAAACSPSMGASGAKKAWGSVAS